MDNHVVVVWALKTVQESDGNGAEVLTIPGARLLAYILLINKLGLHVIYV